MEPVDFPRLVHGEVMPSEEEQALLPIPEAGGLELALPDTPKSKRIDGTVHTLPEPDTLREAPQTPALGSQRRVQRLASPGFRAFAADPPARAALICADAPL